MIRWYEIGEFFLSEWIWSVTYGLYHVPLSMICMFILMRWVARMEILYCVAAIIVAHALSTALFHFGVIGILITLLNFTYQHPFDSSGGVLSPFYANVCLGLIHTFIQSVLFFIAGLWYGYRMSVRMSIISCMSNLASALLALTMLPEM